MLNFLCNKAAGQVTRDVRAYNTTGIIQEPRQFLWTNILPGANISIDILADNRIRINGGAGGGTNVLIQTNGVNIGSVGTLNFIGATGMVAGSVVIIGGFSGGSGTPTISIMTNNVIVSATGVATNLNFISGTNLIPLLATNASGHVSVQYNLDWVATTNGLASISYVDTLSSNRVRVNIHTPFTLEVVTNSSSGIMTYSIGYTNQNGTNWALYPTNVWNDRQGGNIVLSNLVGTVGRNVTNVVSLSTSNATSKPLTSSYTAGVLTLFGLEAGANVTLGMNGSNITISSTGGGGSGLNTNANQFGVAGVTLTLKDGVTVTNLLNVGILNVTNAPGLVRALRIWNTNGQGYTDLTVITNQWLPTNNLIFSITNPSVGQVLGFNSVSFENGVASIIITNTGANNILAPPPVASVPFNHGGFFDATNRFVYDRTNEILRLSGTLPSIRLDDKILLGTNEIWYFGFNTPNSDMIFQTRDSNRWSILGSGVSANQGHFIPLSSNLNDIGTFERPTKTNYTKTLRAYDKIQIGGESLFTNSITLETTNVVRTTNIFRFSITNPVAGQVFKFHNIQNLSGGEVVITVTNDSDNSGGAGSLQTNANQFGASVILTIKKDAFFTNTIHFAGATNETNIIIQQNTGQLVPMLSVRGSNNAPIIEFDNRGFVVLTNSLTNYNRGGTFATPTNTIAIGVENYAGRNMITWFDDKKLQFSTQPFLANNRIYMIFTSASTTPGAFGITAASIAGTTVSHPAPTETWPYMVQMATPATSNGTASVLTTADLVSAGAHNGSSRAAGYFYGTEFALTNGTANVVGGGAPRFFTGLTALANPNLTNLVVTTNATGQYIGLYASPRDQLEIWISARDSGNEFRTNTGINIVASNIYRFFLFNAPTSRMAMWRLQDLTAGLNAEGQFSNNVPTNFMKMVTTLKNSTSIVHSARFSKMYLEGSLTPE